MEGDQPKIQVGYSLALYFVGCLALYFVIFWKLAILQILWFLEVSEVLRFILSPRFGESGRH